MALAKATVIIAVLLPGWTSVDAARPVANAQLLSHEDRSLEQNANCRPKLACVGLFIFLRPKCQDNVAPVQDELHPLRSMQKIQQFFQRELCDTCCNWQEPAAEPPVSPPASPSPEPSTSSLPSPEPAPEPEPSTSSLPSPEPAPEPEPSISPFSPPSPELSSSPSLSPEPSLTLLSSPHVQQSPSSSKDSPYSIPSSPSFSPLTDRMQESLRNGHDKNTTIVIWAVTATVFAFLMMGITAYLCVSRVRPFLRRRNLHITPGLILSHSLTDLLDPATEGSRNH